MLGDLMIRVGAAVEGFVSAMSTVSEKAQEAAEKATESLAGIEDMCGRIGIAGAEMSAAVTLPLAELGKSSLETAAKFEQTQIAFAHFLGGAQEAKKYLSELYTFAAQTPFQIGDVVHGAQSLMALGFAAKDIIPTIRALGDQVSAVGKPENLHRAILALGEMSLATKGYGMQLRELLQDAGVKGKEYLAEAFNIPIGQIDAALKKGLIPGAQAVKAILAGIRKDSGGLMAEQMSSLSGMFTNFQDNVTYTLKAIGDQLLPFGKMFIDMAASAMGAIKVIAQGFGELPQPVQAFIIALAAMLAALGPILVGLGGIGFLVSALAPVMAAAATAIGITVGAMLGWVAVIGVAIAALAGLAMWAHTHWNAIKAVTVAAIQDISEAFMHIFGPAIDWIYAKVAPMGPFFKAVWSGIKETLAALWGGIFDDAKFVWGGITWVIEKFIGVLKQIPGVAKMFDLGKVWSEADKVTTSVTKATAAVKAHTEALGGGGGLGKAAHAVTEEFTKLKVGHDELTDAMLVQHLALAKSAQLAIWTANYFGALNKTIQDGVPKVNKYAQSLMTLDQALKHVQDAGNLKGASKGGGLDFINQMSDGFQKSIQGMLNGTIKFHNAWRVMGVGLLNDWASQLSKMAAQWITHEAMKLVIHQATNAGIVISDSTTAAESDAIDLMSHIKKIARMAAQAAAGAFKAVMTSMPFPINAVLAPAAAAAAFAGTMALGLVSAEHGAVLPNANTMAFLHPNEMVLPSGISKGLQSMIANGGGGGGGHTFNHNVSYKGGPNMSRAQLDAHATRTLKKGMSMFRNNAFARAT